MGDLTLSQYQTRVLLALDNLQSDHPAVSGGLHTQAINDAANDLIREYPDLFPEHGSHRTWTIGPTVAGDNSAASPSNCLTAERLTHSDGETVTTGDWSSVREVPVSPVPATTIGLLEKDSDVTGYPTLWDRKGTDILFFPTTRAGSETTFRLYGTSNETRLTAAGDTFRLHRDYDSVVVTRAAAKVAAIIGQAARALELEAEAARLMSRGLKILAKERVKKGVTFTAAYCPK